MLLEREKSPDDNMISYLQLSRWYSGKESTCQCRRFKRHWFNPLVRKSHWSRKKQLVSVFLPGKFHGKRSLVGYSPWGHRVRHNWVTEHIHMYPVDRTQKRKESMSLSTENSQTEMQKEKQNTRTKNRGIQRDTETNWKISQRLKLKYIKQKVIDHMC